jgi:hypothetical protein
MQERAFRESGFAIKLLAERLHWLGPQNRYHTVFNGITIIFTKDILFQLTSWQAINLVARSPARPVQCESDLRGQHGRRKVEAAERVGTHHSILSFTLVRCAK